MRDPSPKFTTALAVSTWVLQHPPVLATGTFSPAGEVEEVRDLSARILESLYVEARKLTPGDGVPAMVFIDGEWHFASLAPREPEDEP